jgi:hypothetical protein
MVERVAEAAIVRCSPGTVLGRWRRDKGAFDDDVEMRVRAFVVF